MSAWCERAYRSAAAGVERCGKLGVDLLVDHKQRALGQRVDSGPAGGLEHEVGAGLAGQGRRAVDEAPLLRLDAQVQRVAARRLAADGCGEHGMSFERIMTQRNVNVVTLNDLGSLTCP